MSATLTKDNLEEYVLLQIENHADLNIKDANVEELAKAIIACANTGKTYRLTTQEISFYQRNSIPLPRLHWEERLRILMNKRRLIPSV